MVQSHPLAKEEMLEVGNRVVTKKGAGEVINIEYLYNKEYLEIKLDDGNIIWCWTGDLID